MNALLPEILCHVFEQGAGFDRLFNKTSFTVLVSHVCRTWRQTALSLPYLWSTIDANIDHWALNEDGDFPEFDRQYAFIQRSQDHSLNIVLTLFGYVESPSVHRLLSRLTECCDRWEKLSIASQSINCWGWDVVRSHLSGVHVPRLKTLRIGHMWDDDSPVPHRGTFTMDAPALESLRQDCIFWLPVEPFGRQLTQAAFTRTFLSGVDFLTADLLSKFVQSASHLVHLTLWKGPQVTPSDAMEVRFPALRSLRLHLYDFDTRASIIAPDLECMVLTGGNRHGELQTFLASVTGRHPDKRFPNVRHLHLHQFADNQPGLGHLCAQAFRGVETLHINDMRSGAILSDLGTPLGDRELPWPALRLLAVQWTTAEQLLAFVKARLEVPLEALETELCSARSRKYPKSVPERNDMAALEQMVQLTPLPPCITSKDMSHFFDIKCRDCDWGDAQRSSDTFPARWRWVGDGKDTAPDDSEE